MRPITRTGQMATSYKKPSEIIREQVEGIAKVAFLVNGRHPKRGYAEPIDQGNVNASASWKVRQNRRIYEFYEKLAPLGFMVFPHFTSTVSSELLGSNFNGVRDWAIELQQSDYPKFLSMFFLSTHGQKDGTLMIGSSEIRLEELFKELDKFSGRKLVIILSCHSGMAIEILRARASRDSYYLITSSGPDKASSWGEDDMVSLLYKTFPAILDHPEIFQELRVDEGGRVLDPQFFIGKEWGESEMVSFGFRKR
ncbi:hypothetical protein HY988_07710 [Candidatus Micrarchaeota archaeon]|nr:hypothetical protein [Candidatus Micrarchaeota archaeon]